MGDTNVWDNDLDVIANKTFTKIVTIAKSFKTNHHDQLLLYHCRMNLT